MNEKIKLTDYHLNLLLNELSIASLLLGHCHRKIKDDGWLSDISIAYGFIEMCEFINNLYFDRTKEIGRIVGSLSDKKKAFLSRKLDTVEFKFAIAHFDIEYKYGDVIEKITSIANQLQNIEVMFEHSALIKSLIENSKIFHTKNIKNERFSFSAQEMVNEIWKNGN